VELAGVRWWWGTPRPGQEKELAWPTSPYHMIADLKPSAYPG
jgi:hypothetical protein